MKAAILRAPQAPIEICETPIPEPGAGELLIKLQACGICHSDLFIADQAKLPRVPLVLGHEGVGIIHSTGPNVRELSRGQRVGMSFLHHSCGECEYCRSQRENCCPRQVQTGYTADGALAEYAIAAASYVVPVPESLSSVEAAPLCCAGLTAYKALCVADLNPGEWVAIFGAGGLGHLAIQLARHMGLRIAVIDLIPEKLEQAVQLGAELVINARVQNPREAVDRVGGAAAALTLTSSPAAIEQAFRVLKPNGILVLVGLSPEVFPLPVLQTVLRGLRIVGTLVGTPRDLRDVFQLAAEGHIRAQIETCGLENVPAILERMKSGGVLGRAVVNFEAG